MLITGVGLYMLWECSDIYSYIKVENEKDDIETPSERHMKD